MAIIDAIINYRRFLKRRNCSRCTLRNYMSTLKHFVIWLCEPIEEVSSRSVLAFIDHLQDRRLSPKTINCYLDGIRGFYDYLIHEGKSTDRKPGQAWVCAQTLPAAAALSAG